MAGSRGHVEDKEMDGGQITLGGEATGRVRGKQCQTLFFGALKSLQMVIAAMKLEDAYSLEGQL